MKSRTLHIRKIQKLKRKQFHIALHRAHKKHRLSYRTLYYIKSYGQDRHVWHAIVKQSLLVVLFASLISSFGGLWLQSLQAKLALFLPLLIMIPALNSMVGNFGTLAGGKFSTYLFTGRVRGKWWRSPRVHELTTTLFAIAFISAIYIAAMSSLISVFSGFSLTLPLFLRLLSLAILCTLLLGAIILAISFAGGYMIFKRGDDPNNFLVPITTSIADFGSLTIFAFVVTAFF